MRQLPASENQLGDSCSAFLKLTEEHEKLQKQWMRNAPSRSTKRYLSNFLVRCFEIAGTCQMIRAILAWSEPDKLVPIEFEKILKVNSLTAKLSLRGCEAEDLLFDNMRSDFKDAFQEYRKAYNKSAYNEDMQEVFLKLKEACNQLEPKPEESNFSPAKRLSADIGARESSVLTAPPSIASKASSVVSSILDWSRGRTSNNSASEASKNTTVSGSTNIAS